MYKDVRTGPNHILLDKLTLFQSGGQNIPTTYGCPLHFFDTPMALYIRYITHCTVGTQELPAFGDGRKNEFYKQVFICS